jgi:hypothetical protein
MIIANHASSLVWFPLPSLLFLSLTFQFQSIYFKKKGNHNCSFFIQIIQFLISINYFNYLSTFCGWVLYINGLYPTSNSTTKAKTNIPLESTIYIYIYILRIILVFSLKLYSFKYRRIFKYIQINKFKEFGNVGFSIIQCYWAGTKCKQE